MIVFSGIFFALCGIAVAAPPPPSAMTKAGLVRGTWFNDTDIAVFKGIPFAHAPVGKLRWAPPVTPPPSFGPQGFNATEFGPGCIQQCDLQHPDFTCPETTSEDCLSLNVFTPGVDDGRRPVIVWIHGGNYIMGAGSVNFYHGGPWAKDNNVTIVTINYRLGVLGGLYLNASSGAAVGNQNLLDQRAALQWVSENIEYFGGDPNRVTIAGQSAGGFSVASHLASKKSWGLFHRAIPQSNPYSLPTENVSTASAIGETFLQAANCTTWECAQALTSEEVLAAQLLVKPKEVPGSMLRAFMPWTPVVDGIQLEMPPIDAAVSGNTAPVPVMLGYTTNESVQFVWKASPKPLSKLAYEVFLGAIFGSDAKKLMAEYGPPPSNETADVRYFLARLATDYIFLCPGRHVAAGYAANSGAYVYEFSHPASFNSYMQKDLYPECLGYICHGSELPFLFNTIDLIQGSHPYPTQVEKAMIQGMQQMWSSFATDGVPTAGKYHAPKFVSAQDTIARIDTPSLSTFNRLRGDICDFYDSQIGYGPR